MIAQQALFRWSTPLLNCGSAKYKPLVRFWHLGWRYLKEKT